MLSKKDIFYALDTCRESKGEILGSFVNFLKLYQTSGGKTVKLKNNITENGMPGKVNGKISKFGFSYKKQIGKVTAEEVFKGNKCYILVKRNLSGFVSEKVYFDVVLRWTKTEYYSPVSFSVPELTISRTDEKHEGNVLIKKVLKNGAETLLYPSPYFPHKAEQSIVNSKFGENYVVIESGEGYFCYTEKEDAEKRINAFKELENSTLVLMNTWEIKNGEMKSGVDEIEELPEAADLQDEDLQNEDEEEITVSLEEKISEPVENTVSESETISEELTEKETEKTEDSEEPVEAETEKTPEVIPEEITEEAETEEPKPEIKALKVENGVVTEPVEPINKKENKTEEKKLSVPQRYKYNGSMADGMRDGRGRTESSDGLTIYDGEYKADKKDGFGISYFENGDISYAGNWENDKKNGMGVSFRPGDHALNITNWEDGKPGKEITILDAEGNLRFSGEVSKGKKNGTGISVLPENGGIYVGSFEDGEMTGQGSLFSDSGVLLYNGHFVNGVRTGKGTEFDENGEIVYSGEWKDDKYLNGILYQKI